MGHARVAGGSTKTAIGERLPDEFTGESEDWGWAEHLGAEGVDKLC